MSEWDDDKTTDFESFKKLSMGRLRGVQQQRWIISDEMDKLMKKYPNDLFVCARPDKNDPDYDQIHMNPPQAYMNYPELFIVQEFPGGWFYEDEMATGDAYGDQHETFYIRKNSPAMAPALKYIARMIELESIHRKLHFDAYNTDSYAFNQSRKPVVKENDEWKNDDGVYSHEVKYEALTHERDLLMKRIRDIKEKNFESLVARFYPDVDGDENDTPRIPPINVARSPNKYEDITIRGTTPSGRRGEYVYYLLKGTDVMMTLAKCLHKVNAINKHLPAEYV